MRRQFLIGIAALFLATGAAHATLDGCAVVLRTSDGFLNVRAAPKMGARIIARLKPGSFIYADSKSDGTLWMHITAIPRGSSEIRPVSGWVGRRFIEPIACESLEAPTTADQQRCTRSSYSLSRRCSWQYRPTQSPSIQPTSGLSTATRSKFITSTPMSAWTDD